MKAFCTLLLLCTAPLLAEEVTLKQPALLRSDRNAVSLKAGTVVELVSRNGNDITIRYKNFTGKIPASKLDEPKPTAPAAKSAPAARRGADKKQEKKPAESKPASPPRTNYGKAVQKAKDNAAAHDKKLAEPADEILKDR